MPVEIITKKNSKTKMAKNSEIAAHTVTVLLKPVCDTLVDIRNLSDTKTRFVFKKS